MASIRLRIVRGAAIALTVLAAACSGPAGVEVSSDWSGVGGYAIVEVNELATVVGIDVDRAEARSLSVIPDQDEDDKTLGLRIFHDGRSETLLARPLLSGRSALYRVRAGDEAVDRVGNLRAGSTLYPWARGWVEVGRRGSRTEVRVLGGDLAEQSVVELGLAAGGVMAASDGARQLCILGGRATTRVLVLDIVEGAVSRRVVLRGPIDAVACVAGKPVLGRSVDSPDGSLATVTRVGGALLVEGRGRIDGLVVSGRRALMVSAFPDHLVVTIADLARGVVARTVRIDGADVAHDVFIARGELVVLGDDFGMLIDPKSGRARQFELPGRAYPQ